MLIDFKAQSQVEYIGDAYIVRARLERKEDEKLYLALTLSSGQDPSTLRWEVQDEAAARQLIIDLGKRQGAKARRYGLPGA